MIIRHAEKPADDQDINLSAAGRSRAQQLVTLFGPVGRLALPPGAYLFAAKQSKHSNRSVLTVEPLAKATGLRIDHGIEDDHYRDLARLLKTKQFHDATILICWHHGTIPALAKALGVKAGNLPSKSWPDDVFDRVWIIDFDQPGLVAIRSELQ